MKEKFKDIKLEGSIRINLKEKHETVDKWWESDKESLLRAIVRICEDYQRQGYTLTLRQLYYQLVSKDLIPNHDKVYAKLSSLKDEVVYSGRVDWDVFEDRGRLPSTPWYEEDIKSALEDTADRYRLARQTGQPTHIEVWTEKDAISAILKRVTVETGITLVVNKGYSSSTAMYSAYERFVEMIADGKKVKILYFGDHDPSGLDMIRDIEDRIMFMFANGNRFSESGYLYDLVEEWWVSNSLNIYDVVNLGPEYEIALKLLDSDTSNEKAEKAFDAGKIRLFIIQNQLFEIEQIGLTMDQILSYNPPPNPAKITDPRAKGYVKKFGQVSWEVDALSPNVMTGIVKGAIFQIMDNDVYDSVLKREQDERETIKGLVNKLD